MHVKRSIVKKTSHPPWPSKIPHCAPPPSKKGLKWKYGGSVPGNFPIFTSIWKYHDYEVNFVEIVKHGGNQKCAKKGVKIYKWITFFAEIYMWYI